MTNPEVRIYSPTPLLGYGYQPQSFDNALRLQPHLFALDGGSSDPGPNYLGGTESFTNPLLVKGDLVPILKAARRHGVPVIIGTAGGSGGEPHLAKTREILEEIAREQKLHVRMAVIHAEQPAAAVERMDHPCSRNTWACEGARRTALSACRRGNIHHRTAAEPMLSTLPT